MKTKLSIEQSARLIELGVDESFASSKTIVVETVGLCGRWESEVPIFTLTDILSILPKEIDGRDLGMEYDSEFEQWCVGYNGLHLESAPELIDALNSLLIWAIEHNYYNPKTE